MEGAALPVLTSLMSWTLLSKRREVSLRGLQMKEQSKRDRRLAGQIAWISGAASGIGRATAKLFCRQGARVALIDLREDALREVAAGIREGGGECIAVKCDVADERDVEAAIKETVERFGGLSILVNNAGLVDLCQLHTCPDERWERLMQVNLKAIFYSFKHAYNALRNAGKSWMVNAGSISSFVGQAGTPAYTTSKHAVLGLTRSIALDYARIGLRCNCICPGITDTPMLWEHLNGEGDPSGRLGERLKRVPTARALSPQDVARAILYLSSEESEGVTGTSLTIDGGYLAAAEWEAQAVAAQVS